MPLRKEKPTGLLIQKRVFEEAGIAASVKRSNPLQTSPRGGFLFCAIKLSPSGELEGG